MRDVQRRASVRARQADAAAAILDHPYLVA
jgi:hypothetical protein